MRKRRIIVMGFMASCPIAGVVWQHLHYIVGLQRLGHDVYYVEDSARYPYNPQNFATSEDCTHAVQTLHDLAQAFSFGSRWAYCARFLDPPQCFGMHLRRLRQLYTEADAVLNICGAQELHEDLLKNQHLIYVESDPGVEQIYVDLGDEKALTYLGHHQTLFTFGENIGSNSFPVPLHGLRWLPTRQPVVIDFWETESAPAKNAVFSTIANWSTRGKKDVRWKGKNYLWSKTENFLHFIRAPEIASATFEIATEMRDEVVAEEFVARGWRLVSPHPLSLDRDSYRSYIKNSYGEFTVAKDQYHKLNTGWFSDRSACYLAAGRPVITQETGFTFHYGGNKGLFAFSDLDGVREAAEAIKADYAEHSRAAYEIACEWFDAETVLNSLLSRAGV